MKKKLVWGVIVLLLVLNSGPIFAQQYTGVLDVYYQSVVYPEYFDQYVMNNKIIFDKNFFTCLSSLENYWNMSAAENQKICSSLPGNMYYKCMQDNHPAALILWAGSIRAVLLGQILWVNTMQGSAAIIGKRALENMNPGQYKNIVDQMLPILRLYLLCIFK